MHSLYSILLGLSYNSLYNNNTSFILLSKTIAINSTVYFPFKNNDAPIRS